MDFVFGVVVGCRTNQKCVVSVFGHLATLATGSLSQTLLRRSISQNVDAKTDGTAAAVQCKSQAVWPIAAKSGKALGR